MPTIMTRLILLVLFLGMEGCGGLGWLAGRSDQPQAETPPQQQEGLTFETVTLKQTDGQGHLLWQIQAKKAIYSQDQKTVRVENIQGQLFQDGELAFTLRANQGNIQPETETIRLTGDIVVTEVQEKTVLRGRELEWFPQADLLLMRRELQVIHPQARASAEQARVSSQNQTVEVQGKVVVDTHDPHLRIQASHAIWRVAQKTITADPQVQVESLEADRPSDRAVADRAQINLAAKTLTLGPQAQVSLTTPPLEVASPELIWALHRQQITSNQPLKVWHRQQAMVVTANRGNLDLAAQVVRLMGAVQANGLSNRAVLNTDQLTWTIPTQRIAAEGDVVYHQEQPQVNLKGPKAVGKIQDQTIVLQGSQVVTEIFP